MRSLFRDLASLPAWTKRLALVLGAALLMAFPAHALDPTRRIAQFHHTAWTMREGMPARIVAIAQTPDGFLWLGSRTGLYRFDGVRVERVERFGDTPLPDTEIFSLLATPSGDLWIGFANDAARVARMRDGELTVFTEDHGLPAGPIAQIAGDTTGGIWIRIDGTRGEALARFDGHSWRRIDGDFGQRETNGRLGIWSFGIASDGTAWAMNVDSLHYYREGMDHFERATGFAGRISGFLTGRDGRIWTGDRTSGRYMPLPNVTQAPVRISPSTLGALAPDWCAARATMDRDGTIWCINQNSQGISRVRSLTNGTAPVPDLFSARNGLTSNAVYAIFEDREGNIWIGTEQGLDRFRLSNIVFEAAVPLSSYDPKVEGTRGAVYVYTGYSTLLPGVTDRTSAIYRITEGSDPQIVVRNAGEVREFTSLATGDLIYLSRPTLNDRFARYRIRPNRVAELAPLPPASPDLTLENAALIREDSDGNTWYARPGVGFFRFRDGRHTQVISKTSPRLPAMSLRWGATRVVYYDDGQLFEINGELVRQVRVPVFDYNTATSDERRVLILDDDALHQWDGTHFRSLSMERFPGVGRLLRLRLRRGDLWATTESAIIRISEADLDRAFSDPHSRLNFQVFDVNDGLPGTPRTALQDIADSSDRRFWFATTGGLAWIDPERIARNPMPPPVAITALSAGGRVYNSSADVRLPAGAGDLQIDYTALSLTIPERNRFRYRLIGHDENWIDAAYRRQAFYTDLPPGRYRFQVIASNNDGVWNVEGATLSFSIAPTFLQSIWFKLLVVVVLISLGWLAWTIRLRQQAVQLQNRFEVRIAERERIARELHDTMLQSIQGLILRFQSIANRVTDGELRGSINEAIDRADAVVAEGRARVRDLRHSTEQGDLSDALVSVARASIPGDTPQFSLTIEGQPRRLHPLVLDELPRIVEEAVRNVVDHAQASKIEAVLTYGRSSLRLIVRDDGVGMPASLVEAGRPGHFGLTGMRERAAQIGAQFEISSREGAGTEINITVPGPAAYVQPT